MEDHIQSCENAQPNFGFELKLKPHFSITVELKLKPHFSITVELKLKPHFSNSVELKLQTIALYIQLIDLKGHIEVCLPYLR